MAITYISTVDYYSYKENPLIISMLRRREKESPLTKIFNRFTMEYQWSSSHGTPWRIHGQCHKKSMGIPWTFHSQFHGCTMDI